MAVAGAIAPAPLKRLLTAEEVADDYLNCTTDRVWALTREKKLRRVKLGHRTYRYRPDHLAEDIDRLEQEA